MGAGHRHQLYLPGGSVVHRLPPQCKLLAVLAFALVVVATPRERFWCFGAYAALLGGVALAARVPVGHMARRMVIEVPFVLFALLIPVIGLGERITVMGLSLSVPGLWAAWNILAKATLGVAASALLASTTEPREVLIGAQRLRLPSLLVQIAMFMLRYLDVIMDEMRRMRVARESRGFEARNFRQIPVVARSAGALFIRSYERGERVHLAMLSRGYSGRIPMINDISASVGQWGMALALPAAALAVLGLSL
ncbi:cobalt ECF transporter T component CbiQ [Nonomuraea sp. KC401]|uniref:cobalt ECF transporter T component CbiQ n=1 Tax=unclassified Nonomuraea TaxID=2593643 RepID=UPI0010FD7346|nr:cobalt ECF transporter T component CbiQ [Nonomuraea sp. KC401]NBE94588.1 cobalt ECF transporter T component CbiQ [Nonomuraea sp. K271]TLF72666.1 cobalt ECF transporter T component CbiQ [Nonomuraea sp. KC401]